MASYIARTGKPLPAAVRLFSVHRPPGVYKDHYLTEMFKYNHFKRCVRVLTASPLCTCPPADCWAREPAGGLRS